MMMIMGYAGSLKTGCMRGTGGVDILGKFYWSEAGPGKFAFSAGVSTIYYKGTHTVKNRCNRAGQDIRLLLPSH